LSNLAGNGVFLAEVVVFGNGFGDTPGAFEAVRKDYEVARAEGYGIVFVGDRYFAFEDETGFLFGVSPVEGARLALPDRPGFAFLLFGVRRFFYDDVFNGRHIFLLRLSIISLISIISADEKRKRKRESRCNGTGAVEEIQDVVC
jgi:hypothetical protein